MIQVLLVVVVINVNYLFLLKILVNITKSVCVKLAYLLLKPQPKVLLLCDLCRLSL